MPISEDTTDPAPPAAPGRPLCATCRRPLRACLCRWVTPTANRVPLLVLQHPLERDQAKGSLRLLQLSLQSCRCVVDESFDAGVLGDGPEPGAPAAQRSLLLYPSTSGHAPTFDDLAGSRPWQLVLLDGTWRKTRKLLHLNPWLLQLPRCQLPLPPPSRYTTRKAQRPEQRSTLEAACQALGLLERAPQRYEPLLQAFDGWQQAQQAAWSGQAGGSGGPTPSAAP